MRIVEVGWMTKEEYKKIAEYYWQAEVALMNLCSEVGVTQKTLKNLLVRAACYRVLQLLRVLRVKLYRKFSKEFPAEEENPFHPGGWSAFQK